MRLVTLCWPKVGKTCVSLLMFDFRMTIKCNACSWYVPWFSLNLLPPSCTLFNAHALNKRCHVPGRKYAPNEEYATNSKVRLMTRVYGIEYRKHQSQARGDTILLLLYWQVDHKGKLSTALCAQVWLRMTDRRLHEGKLSTALCAQVWLCMTDRRLQWGSKSLKKDGMK